MKHTARAEMRDIERPVGRSASDSMDETSAVSGLSAKLIDPELPTPLYHQVYLVLREKIRSGEIARATPLPGEQEVSGS